MKLGWLLDPVSPQAPCGPDLERADVAAFVDYYCDGRIAHARALLHPRHNRRGRDGREDQVFDPRSIDLPRETEVNLPEAHTGGGSGDG